MNLFFIPSWYPSLSNPIYGTFVKEQIELLAEQRPTWNMGICLWGQGEERKLLWAKHHVFNVSKIARHWKDHPHSTQRDNIYEEYAPCLTWTKRLLNGNLKGLMDTGEKNFLAFEEKVGPITAINAHASWPAAIMAHYLSKKYDVPYTVTIHMSPFPFKIFQQSETALKGIIKEPLEEADLLISTGAFLKKRMEVFGLESRIIHCPIDTTLFSFDEHAQRDNTILAVGRLEEQKGFDLLLKAFAKIKDKWRGRLNIGGAGSLERELKTLTDKLDIRNRVGWLGALTRREVAVNMQRCSFYVLSSRHETFGNVVLEAMACGKPVVSTACGGPEDIVNEKTGVLSGINEEDIAEKMLEMIDRRDEFDDRKIRADVMHRFSTEKWAMLWENTLTTLTGS